jgi:hypothetical protein
MDGDNRDEPAACHGGGGNLRRVRPVGSGSIGDLGRPLSSLQSFDFARLISK